ncbi:MarR family transcriptional regulator [Natronococcus sp. A-GB7]|uniref:helix-turn-helix domain-containing protein n=1 Tax=Natronococcus sp. A-GB7 TaxID=3037649 RepID=UPI00241C78B5|nr:MarR family transcriptional regulator [Natronococcus sp. A-GB7]MDG5821843.1 MarR family transcriptional regulator [Natronococcus sp. A-GB7]
MSENQPREGGGKYGEKVTEQDILKTFDYSDDPFLTTTELAEELPVSRQAVAYRLEQMREKGLVDKKKTGARGAGWWAELAPRLSEKAKQRADAADRENAHSLDDLEERFN